MVSVFYKQGKLTNTSSGKNPCTYITIHQTGNTGKGANAEAHAKLQASGNVRSASWHATVDDKWVFESYLASTRCWHSGSTQGNNSSYAIEICINSDGDYLIALRNAAEYTALKMHELGVPLSKVVQHNYWSGKNCPAQIRSGLDGITWSLFLAMVKAAYKGQPPTTPPPTGGNLTVDGIWGSATTRRLQQVLGTTIDGVISGQAASNKLAPLLSGWEWKYTTAGSNAIRALQKKLGITADGHFGPKTAKALAAHYGIISDGRFDSPSKTIKALQAALNKGVI